jgi:hypothetical protein
VVSLIGTGDHGAILDALQEAADSGRDFKMLYRDLLNFVRNLLLIAGGAGEALLAVSPEDLVTLRAAAEQFSYSDILRIANLLLRDDETVNRAEHQRLAVEIALLKAATFPRLKSVESVIAGGAATSTPAPAPRAASKPAAAPSTASRPPAGADNPPSGDLVARVKQKRPLIGGYLEGARMEREGNRIAFVFDDAFHADSVSDAKDAIALIATELFGEKITIETRVATADASPNGRRSEDKPAPLRDDPVLSAFRKHLGGELVKEKR